MKHIITLTGALALTTSLAQAGGIERAATNIGFLFETGNYAELSFGSISPNVSGVQTITVGPFPAGAKSGNMTSNYTTYSLAVKTQLNERLALGLLLDQPVGADVAYKTDTGYLYGGSSLGAGGSDANVQSTALTALLKFKLNDSISIYGGPKIETAKGNVKLFNGYTMSTSNETDTGYVAGIAYEKPEIALRVALTYASAITHDFTAIENISATPTAFSSEVPQSVSLDFQSGVAKDTLVFGSVRWREWSAFKIAPPALGSTLVEYSDDIITYNLGIGHRFNENWAGAITAGYERNIGTPVGNLGPTDGYTSIGVGGTYTKDNMKISAGATYAWIGDATTTSIGSSFKDNHLIGVGVKVGFSF
jgi:long-chain fatty acid transport protein